MDTGAMKKEEKTSKNKGNLSKETKKKGKRGGVETLSYPIPLRCEHQEKIVRLLKLVQKVGQRRMRQAYKKEILDALKEKGKKAYKILEPLLEVKARKKLTSRLHRGVLEVVGRTLRSINQRRELFEELKSVSEDPEKWDYRKLIKAKGVYAKAEYVKNLAEQTINFKKKNEKLPEDFMELQGRPKMHNAMISYAPDDGQAIQIAREGKSLKIKLKVPQIVEAGEKQKWEWIELKVPLPEFLEEKKAVSPDLRLANIHGDWVPVLDYKVEVEVGKKQKSKYFLTVDWGTRKLITVCVFDKEGNQVSVPIFLQFDPLLGKLLRIRKEIDSLKSKRDKLNKKSTHWYKYNREIAKRWRKFRAINKALSHLAANVIVLIAQIYGCESIHVEWLKGLKSKNFSHLLNWIINSTVRQAIYSLVEYKAKLVGISFGKPVPPAGTSQYCPRCGAKGIHVKASDDRTPCKKGGWFVCCSCSFNADRDYVGCCNLARKVLFGNGLKNQSKGVVYQKTSIPDSLSRQGSSSPKGLLTRNLSGWKDSVFLKPRKYFFCGTLKA